MKLLIVADDLTGALDSAVTLADAGLRCIVVRRPANMAEAIEQAPDVLAVNTASREGSVDDARASVMAVFDRLGPLPEMVFKKIDSRLKGHCGPELRVVAERTGVGRAVITAAIPAQGRVTRGGRLMGFGVTEPIDVGAIFAQCGIAVEVPDAASDADLDRVVSAAMEDTPLLFVGAAGLAAALGRRIGTMGRMSRLEWLERPLMLAIGSHDPITLTQVDALRAIGVSEVRAPDGEIPDLIGEEVSLVRLVPGGDGFDPVQSGARFAANVANAIGADVRTLFACGGETADAILEELGVGTLEVEGEVLSGMPVSTMFEHARRIRLVTKSGGFGTPDSLVSLVRGRTGDRAL